jgi:nicotinate-nucleotide pyrophosphorylase (carboxylating)
MPLAKLENLSFPALFDELVSPAHLATLLRLAFDEDLGDAGDITTRFAVDDGASGSARIVAREAGILAGVPVLDAALRQLAPQISWWWCADDGAAVAPGTVVCDLSGELATILQVERLLLNMLSRLSGVATTTARFVEAVAGSPAVICDTRKTTPGFRAIEKYAVRCGGGTLHRIGLHDAVLIKDNHLGDRSAAECAKHIRGVAVRARESVPLRFVEAEVDSLCQFNSLLELEKGVLDIVLLDNMTIEQLCEAVARRNATAPWLLLEASGGVTLATVRAIAETGVDRIAVGALTHSAMQLDFGLDLR